MLEKGRNGHLAVFEFYFQNYDAASMRLWKKQVDVQMEGIAGLEGFEVEDLPSEVVGTEAKIRYNVSYPESVSVIEAKKEINKGRFLSSAWVKGEKVPP